jgi:CRISPR-associated protein Csd1
LNQYYERLRDNPEVDIPLTGFSRQKIHFALLLDRDGRLLQTLDLRESQGNKKIPKQLTVPEPVKRTVGIAPNFMWDKTCYVLGADDKEGSKRCEEAFEKFRAYHHELGDGVNDEGMIAVLRFLDSWKPEDSNTLPCWDEMAGMNVVFRLDGDLRYVHERPAVKEAWINHRAQNASAVVATCLVSGKEKPIARLHPDIKGLSGAQAKGAALVSFNRDAFESYGKDQNYNAPVSEDIAFAYTTALNYLLRFGGRRKVQIGDATTVFWTERESPVEGFMGMILDPRDDAGDIMDIRLFLEAVRDGKMPTEIGDPNIKFYILGLSPNAARISVRFWHVSSVGEIMSRIGQHFRDLSIVRQYENEPAFPGIWWLLRETAVQRDSRNIHPLLAGALMRSILTGAAYPQNLLMAILGRIRADQEINYLRVALIKACLVRQRRINHLAEEVTMALDKESINVAYRLGRLFAVLEKAQMEAVPGANTTIKDRYYGSASATPGVVFPQLLRLAQHHIQKAEWGRRYDNMIGEIVGGIKAFPTHLSLEDQGMFAIGYYHQRQAFYTKTSGQEEGQS